MEKANKVKQTRRTVSKGKLLMIEDAIQELKDILDPDYDMQELYRILDGYVSGTVTGFIMLYFIRIYYDFITGKQYSVATSLTLLLQAMAGGLVNALSHVLLGTPVAIIWYFTFRGLQYYCEDLMEILFIREGWTILTDGLRDMDQERKCAKQIDECGKALHNREDFEKNEWLGDWLTFDQTVDAMTMNQVRKFFKPFGYDKKFDWVTATEAQKEFKVAEMKFRCLRNYYRMLKQRDFLKPSC